MADDNNLDIAIGVGVALLMLAVAFGAVGLRDRLDRIEQKVDAAGFPLVSMNDRCQPVSVEMRSGPDGQRTALIQQLWPQTDGGLAP